MFLRHLRVRHFRAFDEFDVDFREQGLMLVVGANNSGKSALLSAIDVVAGREMLSPRHHGAQAPAQIEAEFETTPGDRAVLFGEGPGSASWMSQTHMFKRIVCRFTEDINGQVFLSSLATHGPRGVLEEFATTDATSRRDTAQWQLRQVATLPVNHPDPTEVSSFSDIELIQGSAGIDPLRDMKPFNDLLSRWSAHVYHFDAIRTGAPRSSSFGDVIPTLDPSGSNLAQCLMYHSSRDSPTWHRVRDIMSEVLPDVGTLVTPMNNSHVEVAFTDPTSGVRRNVKDLGSGVEQLLMIAYVGVSHPRDGLVLMEEPETSLHPGAQRELLRHLLDWTTDRVFIATTHSPVFLDGRPAGNGQTILVTREDGVSIAEIADNDLDRVLREVGVRLSDVLSAERVLLVEGDSDASLLGAWFPDVLIGRRAAVVPLGGSDRAYHLDTIEQVLGGVDQLGRSVLFIRDRDELGPRRLRVLEADPRIAILRRREIENYLLDAPAAILKALDARLQQSERQSEERFDVATLTTAMREEADKLRTVVVLKRVVEESVPPRLLDRATMREIVRSGPSVERLAAALDAAIASANESRIQLASAWAREEAAIGAAWETDWISLAPGAEVLGGIWRRAALRYDKTSDGARIASAMEHPPAEIADVLDELLGRDEPTSAV